MDEAAKFEDIQACVFDAYGTVFDVAAAVRRCCDALDDKTDQLAKIWREKQAEYAWLRSLMGKFTDFWHVTGNGLDYATRTLGIEDLSLRARLMDLYLRLDPFPEVAETLVKLREGGIKSALLSDASVTMLMAASKHAGILPHFSGLFSVDAARVYKPHPDAYRLATDGLGLEPRQVCFMSSKAWDVAGAKAFGFRTVWVNREGQPPEELPDQPEREIRSLTDLPPLLGL